MTIAHIVILLIAALVGVARAAAERVVDFFSWNNSIFANKYPLTITVEDLRNEAPKFTHPREVSWKRKHTGSPIVQKLLSTVLVGFTDLWHFGDWFTALAAFILIPLTIVTAPALPIWATSLLALGAWASYAVIFHLFYHKFFYQDVLATYRVGGVDKPAA